MDNMAVDILLHVSQRRRHTENAKGCGLFELFVAAIHPATHYRILPGNRLESSDCEPEGFVTHIRQNLYVAVYAISPVGYVSPYVHLGPSKGEFEARCFADTIQCALRDFITRT